VIDPVLLGIGDRRFLAVEAEIDLAQRAAGPRPAHQRLDETGIGGIVFESPFPRQRLARLHGRLGRPINPRLHPFHLCTCILAGLSGRGDWIRTSDFLLPKQALYQTELHPAAPKRPAEPSAFYHSPRRAGQPRSPGRKPAGQKLTLWRIAENRVLNPVAGPDSEPRHRAAIE